MIEESQIEIWSAVEAMKLKRDWKNWSYRDWDMFKFKIHKNANTQKYFCGDHEIL